MVFANVFSDNVEAGNPGWTAQSPWAITTTQAHSPTHSWTDSPGGNYLDNVNTAVTSPAIDLSAAVGVELSFWQRYATEATYDFCHVEVSADNGANWTELAAYDGTQTTWTRAVFLVPQLDGALQAKVRFRLTSDVSVQVRRLLRRRRRRARRDSAIESGRPNRHFAGHLRTGAPE